MGVQQLLWLTGGDKRQNFLLSKILMSALDSVTPFARSYIIYFSQLSCQSLFKEFIGRGKRLGKHKEAFWGSFFPSVGSFELTVSNRSGKLASKPNRCLYECSLRLRLEKILFKQSQHDQKPNCNTDPASKAGCGPSKAKLEAVICEQHI